MLRELLDEFASNYSQTASGSFHSGTNADLIVNQIPDAITKLASISEKYRVYGSYGKGNWADVPWVVILDKDITTSTQDGYGVGLLFSSDMKTVNLVFGLGWDQFEDKFGIKEGRYRAINTVKHLSKVLRSPLQDFIYGNVPLNAQTTTGKGYETTSIYYKTYYIGNLPSDASLIDDIRNILGVYREVKGYIGKDLFNLDLSLEEELTTEMSKNIKPEFLTNFRLKKPTEIDKSLIKKIHSRQHVDFDEVHRRNSQTGLKGEQIVLENEKQYLSQLGKHDLAGKVQLVSDDISKGYDILSYSLDGKEKYIEVKSTLNKYIGQFNFYISSNEKKVSETLSNYYLYFVFDVSSNKPKVVSIKDLFSLNGLYTIEPVSYRVTIESEIDS